MAQPCLKANLRELGLQRSLVFSDLIEAKPYEDYGCRANQNIHINLYDVFH